MDWVTGAQKAIDYVEDNLIEELDYEKIAARACVLQLHTSVSADIIKWKSYVKFTVINSSKL